MATSPHLAIYLLNMLQVTLVHRRSSFGGHIDSVEKISELAKDGKVNLITEAEVIKLKEKII